MSKIIYEKNHSDAYIETKEKIKEFNEGDWSIEEFETILKVIGEAINKNIKYHDEYLSLSQKMSSLEEHYGVCFGTFPDTPKIKYRGDLEDRYKILLETEKDLDEKKVSKLVSIISSFFEFK